MSHVTPVKICVLDLYERKDGDKEPVSFKPPELAGRIGAITKFDFKQSLDPDVSFDYQIFRNTKGYHISGNHRHLCKEMFRDECPADFESMEYWNQTLSQIYVGLSPGQARGLEKADNDLAEAQIEDTMESTITVSIYIYCSFR